MDEVQVFEADGRALWHFFEPHHYMSGAYHGHGALAAVFEGQLVGLASWISYPSGTIPQPCRREHRTVILPDFQGMGIGVRLSDLCGDYQLARGYRFFSKTSHPRMGQYRNASPFWRATSKNEMVRLDGADRGRWELKSRFAYSHEFVGSDPALFESVLAGPTVVEELTLPLDHA